MHDKIKICFDISNPSKGDDGLYHYFYRIRNIFTSKEYYGIHTTKKLDDGYSGSGVLLKKAIRKYGISGFIIQPLKFFKTRIECSEYEKDFISKDFLSSNKNILYNVAGGGENGHFIPDIVRKKISFSERGKTVSDETKNKISASLRGRKVWNKGLFGTENKMTGLKRSELTKQNISNGLKEFYKTHDGQMFGKHHSKETREKISNSNKGKKLTELHKKHLSESKIGFKVSEKTKKSISDTMRAMCGNNGYCKRKSYILVNIGETFNSCKELYKFICKTYGKPCGYVHFCKLLRTKGKIGDLEFQENL